MDMVKWMVMLTRDQKQLIEQTAEKTGLKGSDVIREMVKTVTSGDFKTFVNSLSETQTRILVENLESKKRELDEKIRDLKGQIGKKANYA